MTVRQWEKWWEEHAPLDFLRSKSRAWRFEIASQVAAEVGGSALDVGCASCAAYPYFKKVGVKYTGMDITQKFLDYARTLYPEVDVRRGNIVDPPFQDNSFDTVFCINTFVNFHPNEYHIALNNIIRLARKRVMLTFYKTPWNKPMSVRKGEYFYSIRYNKDDLMTKIKSNEKTEELLIRKIRGDELYIVRLKEPN